MIISIDGLKGRAARELEEAARFYADILLHPKTIPHIRLDIEIVKDLEDEGQVINEDDTARSRYFTIQLRNRRGDDHIIKTLAHEMVHLKQYVKNELQSGVIARKGTKIYNTCKWKGKAWLPNGKDHEYFDAPWEIEAYGREVGLFQRWIAHVRGE